MNEMVEGRDDGAWTLNLTIISTHIQRDDDDCQQQHTFRPGVGGMDVSHVIITRHSRDPYTDGAVKHRLRGAWGSIGLTDGVIFQHGLRRALGDFTQTNLAETLFKMTQHETADFA